MPYFLRIHGGIGMHAGYLPGYPASHGCIRLPKEMAARFFQNVPIETPVAIRQEAPREYGPNPLIPERFAPLTSITER
jgi:L,D-transpeptidase catalytic domain